MVPKSVGPVGDMLIRSTLRRGPPSGWVNLRENGRDMLVIDTEGAAPRKSRGDGSVSCVLHRLYTYVIICM